MNLDEYFHLERLVGEGTYGQVFKAIVKKDIYFEGGLFSSRRRGTNHHSHNNNNSHNINITRGNQVSIRQGTVVAVKRVRQEKEGLSLTTAREIRFLCQFLNAQGLACRHSHVRKCCEMYRAFHDQGKFFGLR